MPDKFTDIEEEILSEAPADTTAPLDREDQVNQDQDKVDETKDE